MVAAGVLSPERVVDGNTGRRSYPHAPSRAVDIGWSERDQNGVNLEQGDRSTAIGVPIRGSVGLGGELDRRTLFVLVATL